MTAVTAANPAKYSKGFGSSVWPGHGQTTVKNDAWRVIEIDWHAVDQRFGGADDGNRTRVFSLGS
jgi:hypothetical protein